MIQDIALNTQIITERGKSLIEFVQVYKEITQTPKLKISEFQLSDLIKRVHAFYQGQIDENKISFFAKNGRFNPFKGRFGLNGASTY